MRAAHVLALPAIARACFPGRDPRSLRSRARLVAAGLGAGDALGPLLDPPPGGALARALAERPELLGALVWPYQCASWDREERLARLAAHYAELDRIGPPFPFPVDARLVLAGLDAVRPGLALVLDQPRWFLREGGLTLNLFDGDFRAFSLAFSLAPLADGGREAVIGAVQGRSTPEAPDLYRALTRELHGLRPRDFLIEAFRMLCRRLGVARIRAVAEAARHHRHPYFGAKAETLGQDYDAIWEERGATRLDAAFHALAVAPERRPLADIKAKKRAEHRRRYAFLDALEGRIAADLAGLAPVRFQDR